MTSTVERPRVAVAAPAGRLPLNTFGIAFGLAGAAGSWTALADAGLVTPVIADVLWCLVTVALVATLVRYVARAGGPAAVLGDLRAPVLGPFAALVPVTTLLLGAQLTRSAEVAGQVVVLIGAVAAVAFGAWFFAGLLAAPRPVEALHSGYLLPTTAAALIAGQSFAVAGWEVAAHAAFGVGVLSWLLVGSLLLARFVTGTRLPEALVPTLAIFSAPPAVAGNAWFATGAGTDEVQQLLLGTFVLLMGAQLFLVPRYLRLPFALGWWALTFTTAAGATYVVHWLALAQPAGWLVGAWGVVLVASGVVAAVAALSVRHVVRARARPPAPRRGAG